MCDYSPSPGGVGKTRLALEVARVLLPDMRDGIFFISLAPLSPQAILERLQSRLSFLTTGARNLPRRQQTLRNTLNWSYDLLDEQEQRFFRQLGVCVGNWTLEAAQAVGQQEDEQGDALELLSSLVDKSLVRVLAYPCGVTRFTLLETIREYTLDCLERHGEREEAEGRHARYFLELAEEAELHLYGAEQGAWLERLDREAANLWTAMRVVIASRQAALALRLASVLSGYLQLRGSLSEGRTWFEEALALDEPANEHTLVERARVLYGAGVMAHMQNDLAAARTPLEESRTLAARLTDQRMQALALGALAMLEMHQGNYESARAFAGEGRRLFREHLIAGAGAFCIPSVGRSRASCAIFVWPARAFISV